MTDKIEQRRNPIPPERLAEAGVWVARLHSGEPDTAAIAGVKRWLKAHPINARALELCTEIWEESANLRRITPFAAQLAASPKKHRLLPSAAAAAVLALIAGALLECSDDAVALAVRLDLDVSGLMLVAKDEATHLILQRQFARREIVKRYDAILDGVLDPSRGESGTIESSSRSVSVTASVPAAGKLGGSERLFEGRNDSSSLT